MNSFIWLGTLGALYLFFTLSTPVKPAPPLRPLKIAEVEKTFEDSAVEDTPQEPVKIVYESNPVDIAKGKAVYLSTCIKCHNKDPNVKGPIGPELVDAPLEVMQHKVATGRYPEVLPPGFVPKRKTKQMAKLPNALMDVPSIHAYVQSLKKK